jgi:hypothetical protein
MTLVEQSISPILRDTDYRKREWCYLTPEMGANEIEPNVVYRDGKQLKFLLLPKALPNSYLRVFDVLHQKAKQNEGWKKGSRKADGQRRGKKITVGWFPQLPGHSVGSGYYNVRTAATLENPEILAALYPMLWEMDDKVAEYLPAYHKFALNAALSARRPEGEEDDLSRVPRPPEHLRDAWPWREKLGELSDDDFNAQYAQHRATTLPDPHGIVKNLDPWDMTYTIRGTIFSTVELNRNIIFKAHEDKRNVRGTCVCITAMGTFVGGRLVFPRYGVSAKLGPMDLLICDNNEELHGNLGPIVGERFSVVAYLYSPLLGRAKDEEW